MEKKLAGTIAKKNELHNKEKCSSQPGLKKRDIHFNVNFKYFDDDQLEWITQKLFQNFPGKDMNMIFNILLPEALMRICRDFFEVINNEAND